MAKRFKVGDYIEIIDVDSCWDGRRARVVEIRAGQPVVAAGDAAAAGLGVLWGNAFNNGRLRKVKHLGQANDNIPEDEMVLAELIQNAAARGLHSTKAQAFGQGRRAVTPADLHWDNPTLSVGTLEAPPDGADCCCAMGAQCLSPGVSNPVVTWSGNDCADDETMTYAGSPEFQRSWNIGAAFEQALRPE